MKIQFLILVLCLFHAAPNSFGQGIVSGVYDSGLYLAYDNDTKKLTGYFENYTGWNHEYNYPRFSCIFYLSGLANSTNIDLITYYPNDTLDHINGKILVHNPTKIGIRLKEEHGGCWNVQHFADTNILFNLVEAAPWTAISFVTGKKAYFHTGPSSNSRQKSYVVQNDFVCVEKKTDGWVYATYFGKSITKGWLKASDLNN